MSQLFAIKLKALRERQDALEKRQAELEAQVARLLSALGEGDAKPEPKPAKAS